MKNKIVIRRLKPEDAKATYALMRSVLNELARVELYPKESITYDLIDYRPKNFVSYIKSRYNILLGAFEGKKIVGMSLGFVEYGGLINIDWIIISHNYRGLGIGRKLIKRVEFLARRKKLHMIYADTEIKNKEAIAFEKKLGYKKIATLKNWNFHETRYLWAKELK